MGLTVRARAGFVGALTAAAAVALLASSCTGSEPAKTAVSKANDTVVEGTPKPGGSLVFGLQGETDGWIPQANRWSPSSITIAKAVYDPLVIIGTDGKVHPYVVESMTPVNGDAKQWDIKMRDGVMFHNGEKLDAEALRLNLQGFRDSALSATAFRPITDMRVIDPSTLRLDMSISWASFPTLFIGQAGFIVAPAQLKAMAYDKPVGTGPFEFVSWSSGAPFKATKNEAYWQKGLPYLDAVEFRVIGDNESRRKALESKDIDLAHTNAAHDLMRMVKDNDPPHETRVLIDESEGDEYNVVLNTQEGPFQDRELRLALAEATDRQSLVTDMFDGFFDIADQPYAKASPWHSDITIHGFDLESAKKRVAAYAAAHGGTAPAFTYTTVATSEDQTVAQVLQEQWKRAGFQVTLDAQDETKFAANIVFGKYDVFAFRFWNSPDPDGDSYFWQSSNVGEPGGISLNFPRYKSDVVEQALLEGRTSADEATRKAAYAKVWQDWADNVPYLFVFHSKWSLVANERVRGLQKLRTPEGVDVPPIIWGSTFLTTAWIEDV
jgi:4-phytase/acid phosphatase/peptide/nickel transport system substrate-binding protein